MIPVWLLDRASSIAPAAAAAGAIFHFVLVIAGHAAQSQPTSALGDERPTVAASDETPLHYGTRPGLDAIRALPERHLFGTPEEQQAQPDAFVFEAAEAGLALSGILHDTDGSSLAIVLSDGGPTEVVAVGDVLPSGQRVERIDAAQVLLRSEQGKLASLTLPRPRSLGPAPSRPLGRAVAANPQPVGRSGRIRYPGSTAAR